MANIKFNWPIWGHKRIIKSLQNSILNDKLTHAYLFSGPPQIGKMTVARYFLKSIQCQGNMKPCQKCESCLSIERNTHLDTVIIDHENSIKIEDMRELQHKFSLKHQVGYKIALINNAENMTEEAANSILKFLEEPKGKAVIILITEAKQALLPTIISRCQIIKFLPVPVDIIKKELYNLSKDRQKASEISSLSLGRPGLARALLESPEIIKKQQKLVSQLERLYSARLLDRVNFVAKVAKDKALISEILDTWLAYFRDSLLALLKQGDLSMRQSKERFPKPKKYSKKEILRLIKQIYQTKLLLSWNVNPRLALENLVISF